MTRIIIIILYMKEKRTISCHELIRIDSARKSFCFFPDIQGLPLTTLTFVIDHFVIVICSKILYLIKMTNALLFYVFVI